VEHFIEDGETEKTFIEVKGVTLENNGVVLFPDAPTQRGIKHIKELEKCVKDGHKAYILFVVQMKGATEFRPNEQTHKDFADALRHAVKSGVKIIARDCVVTPDTMQIDKKVDVLLYKNILLDLDDTIFDFKKAEHQALIETLSNYSVDANDDVVQRYSEINVSQWKLLEKGEITRAELKWRRFKLLFDELGKECPAEEVAEYYTDRLSRGSFLLEGALEVLESLYKKYNLYIVSNGFAKTQHGRIASGNIKRFFKGIFISQEIGADKPSPEFFNAVFSQIPDFDKNKTIIVGDSLSSDIKGGKNAGITTVWINRQKSTVPEELLPDFEINDISELLKIL
jgi:2-haloacid dehalogenase